MTIAKAFGLKGTVQSLPDGRVKVEAEGGETDVRLDTAVDHLKVLIDLTKQGLGKQDQMLDKQDLMLGKIGSKCLTSKTKVIEKIDEAKRGS